jgi:hypothetical protein
VKSLIQIVFSYLFLLVLTLFVLLIAPKSFSMYSSRKLAGNDSKILVGSVKCQNLKSELENMKLAQSSIIHSLIQNHYLFAEQLGDLSFELALYKKTIPQKTIESMDKSAQAYRIRSLKAEKTAEKLEDLTLNLINKIQKCLK